MQKFILFIFLILQFSCSNEQPPTTKARPELSTTESTGWANPKTWGEKRLSLNTKSEYENALVDPRIDQIYKDGMPDFLKTRVLWRVGHDGSCWVSVALTLLLYELTNQDQAFFSQILGKMQKQAVDLAINENDFVKNFFAILEVIKEKNDFKLAVAMLNHEKVFYNLNMGLRQFLKVHEGDNTLTEIMAKPCSWGDAQQYFGRLFKGWGIKFFDIRGAPNNIQRSFYLPSIEFSRVSFRKDFPQLNLEMKKVLDHKNFIMLSFVPSPSFADILVSKTFAEQFNKKD